MRTNWARASLGIGAVWVGCAHAHHSGAVFDLDLAARIELRGVVVDFKLRSPHASFVVDAQVFENGEPRPNSEARWEVEWQSAPMLRTLGIEPGTFAAGDEITILAAPHRERAVRFAHALAVVDAFGEEYVMANSDRLFSPSVRRAAAVADEGADELAISVPAAPGVARLNGLWQQPLLEFPAAAPNLPVNDAGMAAWRGYDPKLSPANTCEPMNVPSVFLAPFFLFELRVDSQRAVLHNEAYDVERTVRLGVAPTSVDSAGRYGRATARIDGDSLVVESRDFPASRWGLGHEEAHGGADVPSSAEKALTETFSVTPDGRTLVYAYTLDDPTYLTQPYTGRVELTRAPDDAPLYRYECDVESAAMWSRVPGDAPLRVGD